MIRYALTHLQKDGLRALATANQGREFYDTKKDAEEALEAFLPGLQNIGMRALEVRKVECYDNGDAKEIYFLMRLRKVTGRPFLCFCWNCGFKLHYAGDSEIDPRHPDASRYPVYADQTGPAFKAYYCAQCANPILEIQLCTREGCNHPSTEHQDEHGPCNHKNTTTHCTCYKFTEEQRQ